MTVVKQFSRVLIQDAQDLLDITFIVVAHLEEVDGVGMSTVLTGAGGSGVV